MEGLGEGVELPAAFLAAIISDMRVPVYGSMGSSAGDGLAMAIGRGRGNVETRAKSRKAIEKETVAE